MRTPATLLDFERTHPQHSGWKDETIRAELGINPAVYYMRLARAAATVEGMAHDPITARRVRERREARGQARESPTREGSAAAGR